MSRRVTSFRKQDHPLRRTARRMEALDLFGRGPGILAEMLRQCPQRMWVRRPAGNGWSIHETILHLADTETETYLRCRQFIAEPGTIVPDINTLRWAATLGYYHQSTKDALGLLVRLRNMTYRILQWIPDCVWRHVLRYADKRIVTLEDWLAIESQRIPHHTEQIRQNYLEWRSQSCRQRHARLVAACSASMPVREESPSRAGPAGADSSERRIRS